MPKIWFFIIKTRKKPTSSSSHMHIPKSTTDEEALLPKHIRSHDLVSLFGTGTQVSPAPTFYKTWIKRRRGSKRCFLDPFLCCKPLNLCENKGKICWRRRKGCQKHLQQDSVTQHPPLHHQLKIVVSFFVVMMTHSFSHQGSTLLTFLVRPTNLPLTLPGWWYPYLWLSIVS